MAKKIPKSVPVPEAIPKPYVPRTPVSESEKNSLYQDVCLYWKTQAKYYGWTGDHPENIERRLQSILGAVDLETAEEAHRKTRGAMQFTFLAAWANSRIPGPDLPENWEKKAKRAESLAKMLDAKDDVEGAKRQYRKMEEYQERADKLQRSLDKEKEKGA